MVTSDGRTLLAQRGRPDGRDLPARPDPRRARHAGRRRAGRARPALVELAQALEQLGLTLERFKTGTPPRIDGRIVDFSRTGAAGRGLAAPYWFSHFAERAPHPRAAPLLSDLDRARAPGDHPAAPRGLGAVRRSHQRPRAAVLSVDRGQDRQVPGCGAPSGLPRAGGARHVRDVRERAVALRLPPEVQLAFLRTVPGLEQRPDDAAGYAIEYDYFPPHAAPSNARDARSSRALPGRADQRHDRVRGGGRPRRPGRDQRGGACARTGAGGPAPRRGVHRRAGRRSGDAAASTSRTDCSRRGPSSGCSCVRTTRYAGCCRWRSVSDC